MTKQERLARELTEDLLIKELRGTRKEAKNQLKELETFGLVKFGSEGNFMLKEIVV